MLVYKQTPLRLCDINVPTTKHLSTQLTYEY